jgi:methylglutaconyl-CoA hydratase
MKLVEITYDNHVSSITINRPEKRNALSSELVSALNDAFHEAISSSDARVIVLKAAGTVFSAGADLAYLQQLQENTYEENLADSNHLRSLFELIYTSPKPVVAQVQGDAIAGGCGLVSVCDIVVTTSTARFGFTEVKIGFIPALVSVFLLKKIGESQTRKLLLEGGLIDALAAKDVGIVHEIVEESTLDSYVKEKAEKLARTNSPDAMQNTKKLILELSDLSVSEGLNVAEIANAKARASEDCKKGIAAFLNKEKISW